MNDLNSRAQNFEPRYRYIGHSVRWYREEHLHIPDGEFADQVGIPLTVLKQIEAGDCEHCLGELILISLNSDFPLEEVLDDVVEQVRLHKASANYTVARCLVEMSQAK